MSEIPFESKAEALKFGVDENVSAETTEFNKLNAEAQRHDLFVQSETITNQLKREAFEQAKMVVFGLSFFLAIATFSIMFLKVEHVQGSAQAVIFAAPIAAISAITIFLVLGVFGGNSKKTPIEQASDAAKISKSAADIAN